MTTVALKPATMAQALTRALRDAMTADPTVHVMGEDVGALGGVFRVTDGLAKEFGEDRVTDTPLAEAGILGTAVGMAMYGLRPVVEMQFDAFAYPAFEQLISHVARMRNRTRGAMPLPITIRVPYGGGIGGVEHHSDSSEAYYMATPGLHVVTPATVADAYGLLRAAIASDDPVVFLEPKRLYWSKDSWNPEEPQTVDPIGRAVVRRATAAPRSSRTARPCPSAWRPPRRPRPRAGTSKWSTCAPWCPSTTRRSPRRSGGPGARWSSTSPAPTADRAARSRPG